MIPAWQVPSRMQLGLLAAAFIAGCVGGWTVKGVFEDARAADELRSGMATIAENLGRAAQIGADIHKGELARRAEAKKRNRSMEKKVYADRVYTDCRPDDDGLQLFNEALTGRAAAR